VRYLILTYRWLSFDVATSPSPMPLISISTPSADKHIPMTAALPALSNEEPSKTTPIPISSVHRKAVVSC